MPVAACGGADVASRRVRLLRWIVHHHHALWLVLGPAAVVASLVPLLWPMICAAAVFTGGLLLQVIALRWHDQHPLCPRCQAHAPADGAAQAARRARTLAAFHRLSSRRLAGYALAAVWVLCVAWPGYGLDLPLVAVLAVRDYCQHVHEPLWPWCPRCRPRGSRPARAQAPA